VDTAEQNFTFLLLNGFSAFAFFSAIEPLRVANRLSGRKLFGWQILSVDGAPVEASNGMRLIADARLDVAPKLLIVCAGFDHQVAETPALMAALRRIWRAGATIGAMDTATHILARAGLLGDRAVTMHWEAVPGFRERFPDIPVTDELFKIHDRLFTCAGGTAALDMMLDWIGRHHGAGLAAAVSEQFIHDRIRSAGDSQRLALSVRLGTSDQRLLAIVAAMEASLDEPLPIAALATGAGINRRQIERLFHAHMGHGPAAHYRLLRLERARSLVQSTDMAMIEIAMATGFASQSALARAYHRQFGHPPSTERRQL